MKKIINLGALVSLILLSSFTFSNPIQFLNKYFITDTIPCRLIGVTEAYYKKILSDKFVTNEELNKLIVSDTSTYSINYFNYNRSSGLYTFIKIITDSAGNYRDSEISRNYKVSASSKSYKKAIQNLKSIDYNFLVNESKFLVSNCYISDGDDLLVYIRMHGKIFYGIAIVDIFQNFGFEDPLKYFIVNSKSLH